MLRGEIERKPNLTEHVEKGPYKYPILGVDRKRNGDARRKKKMETQR